MKGLIFKEDINYPVFLDFANTGFKCPNCDKKYSDIKGIYLDKCNANKSGYTKIKCSCGNKFGMTYNFCGNAVSFFLQ